MTAKTWSTRTEIGIAACQLAEQLPRMVKQHRPIDSDVEVVEFKRWGYELFVAALDNLAALAKLAGLEEEKRAADESAHESAHRPR